MNAEVRWLWMDSCGPVARMALLDGEDVRAEVEMVGREFSAAWAEALRGMLREAGWTVGELKMVAVVAGPGGFTGVRVGLAAAKGLCEASGAKLMSLSRLEVLAGQGVEEELVVLDAGRGEWYVRDGEAEMLIGTEELVALAGERGVVTAEVRNADALGGVKVREVEMGVGASVGMVMERWRLGAVDDVASVDANYVRGEREIYGRAAAAK